MRNLEAYLYYTEKSVSPESYHMWTYLSMVASILGKKTFIKCSYFNVYPNMYIILASMPGIGKKSTAIRLGRDCVVEADLDPKIRYSNDSQTPQALMIEMENAYGIKQLTNGKMFGSSALTILASELVSLLSNGPPMVDFLTDIYDSDKQFEYKTKNSKNITIKNPCLNILSGVTTDSLNARVIRDATAGGFMSRSIVIYDNKTRSGSAFDMPDQGNKDARSLVIERFREVNELYGEMGFGTGAIDFYKDYEYKETEALKLQPMNVEFRSRKPIHVLKCAMLLAASELRMTIEETDLMIAVQMLERVQLNMRFIHMSSGNHKNAEIHSRIILALGKVQSIDYHEMLSHFMTSTDEETFAKSIQTLENVGWIQVKVDTNTKPATHTLVLTSKGHEMFNKYDK